MQNPPIAWSVGGTDSGGGAGIQADARTFADFGVHGAAVVTTVTAQNTVAMLGGHAVPAATVRQQLEALQADLPADAVKIGALGSDANAAALLDFLAAIPEYRAPLVVWDPVRQASVGGDLGSLSDETLDALLRRADVVTPNLEELSAWGIGANDPAAAARGLRARGARAAFVTGGHGDRPGTDFYSGDDGDFVVQGEPLAGAGAHGGGCSLASALTAARLREPDAVSAPVLAHMYVHQGLRALAQGAAAPGSGRPPLPHLGWPDDVRDLPRVFYGEAVSAPPLPRLSHGVGLYAVVGSAAWVRRSVELGVDTVQLRIKNIGGEALRTAVDESVAATRGTRTRLFVNDYWREAVRAGAYGVHLGQEDLDSADLGAIADAGVRLGVSTHSYHEIARAHAVAPSYVAIGPIYATTTKPMKFAPQGVDRLRRWVRLLEPLYSLTAIGGIDIERTPAVAATGVGSIAVVRAITEAADPAAATAELRRAMEGRGSD